MGKSISSKGGYTMPRGKGGAASTPKLSTNKDYSTAQGTHMSGSKGGGKKKGY